MNVSVLVIAHNEEVWIERCLISLFSQDITPSEIVVLLHNCTDNTKSIASKFSVQIVECTEDGGPIIARVRGIEACKGDIICCIDGDAWADPKWVRRISTVLYTHPNISIVGGYTKIENNLFWKIISWFAFWVRRKLLDNDMQRFAYGSNFAFRKKDYERVGGMSPFLTLHKTLNINY